MVAEDLLESEVVDSLNADFDAAIAATQPGVPNCDREDLCDFLGHNMIRIDGLAGCSKTFQDVICRELLLGVADHFLLPNCERYTLNAGQLIEIQPGEKAQFLHYDENIWNYIHKPHPRLEVEALFALTDFTETVAAIRVVPGSHLWDRERTPEEHEVVSAVMPARSAVFYLGSTFHGGGANQSENFRRRGLFIGYCLGWLRAEENLFLSTPRDVVRDMPDRVQELLDYEQHFGLGALKIGSPMNLLK